MELGNTVAPTSAAAMNATLTFVLVRWVDFISSWRG
jgi:hypothetical protein